MIVNILKFLLTIFFSISLQLPINFKKNRKKFYSLLQKHPRMPKGLKRGNFLEGHKMNWRCPCCGVEKEMRNNSPEKLMKKMMLLHMKMNHPEILDQFENTEFIFNELPKGINIDMTNGRTNGASHEDMKNTHKVMEGISNACLS